MRYLFLSLVLLNILYALWQLQGSPGGSPPTMQTAPPVSANPVVQSPQPSTPVPPPDEVGLCVTLGKFSVRATADQLRQRLLALDIHSELQIREVISGTDYWLVMRVVGGERHALIQLSALQEQGIDSFLITRGEMGGNLSLGVFSREDYAQVRQEQLQQLGHDVRIHPLSKKDQQFVIEVGSKARRLVDQAMLTRLRVDFPGLQHQYEPCRGVANAGRIP
ncbi:hypothetical protein SAMN05216198_3719 [Halopseudomonas litoralis]|uniref:Sporulation related domain-containing protein n=1 Tax=Halopseudomonas litoralis TaxID=797277 RepID=A0A1H1XT41_9GAMM|nr:SPOR domain-containing protein [Halopseudomonas litoralis]SDT12029.1 hypothetical protein SAMN05216198_3719 [Halopseudomonas litoralis]